MNDIFLVLILLPGIFGLLCLIVPKKLKAFEGFALMGCLAVFFLTAWLFLNKTDYTTGLPWFYLDNLARFILPAIGLFGVLIVFYSLKFMAGKERLNEYYAYTLWTIGASCGAILANNLILLLAFWGFLGLTLYLLIGIGGPQASGAAKKTLIIIGFSDGIMVFGVAALWVLTGSFEMNKISVMVPGLLSLAGGAFIALIIAAFAKAGAMPFHTWIPDMAESAPIPVTAFLPASLDKLLGIYLLARIALNLFIMSKEMGFILLSIGAVTIICAVMMALIQHDLKKLLSYHAVSQVGYMVLGIGTGNPIGIAGGLFHMLNNAIYKQGLFLGAGIIEKQTGTSKLQDLGALFKNFPVTFVSFTVCAMAISGIPPFNGFVSKWMVYQGIVEMGKNSGPLWVLWLTAALFGSVLTLASFVKVIHAVFLGQPAKGRSTRRENLTWELPALILLPLACIVIGVFPHYTVYPVLESILGPIAVPGLWQPQLAAILLISGIGVGVLLYAVFKVGGYRVSETYIGGEKITPEMRVSGVEFYATIENLAPFPKIYGWARKGYFDIYNWAKGTIFYIFRPLSAAHSGVLSTYIIWCLVGAVLVLYVLMK